jgi:hypothetical protein
MEGALQVGAAAAQALRRGSVVQSQVEVQTDERHRQIRKVRQTLTPDFTEG